MKELEVPALHLGAVVNERLGNSRYSLEEGNILVGMVR
jgi:hypothetical protein